MRNVEIAGLAIKDLSGLQASLVSEGFIVIHCESAQGLSSWIDETRSASSDTLSDKTLKGSYTRIVLDDAETKDPAPVVLAFQDVSKRRVPMQVLLRSPDGTIWNVTVDDSGRLT